MLNIKIRSVDFGMTPAIEEYVTKKVGTLEKHLGEGTLCEVELGKITEHHKSGDIYKAELNVVRGKIGQSYVVAEASDLYAAIDMMRDSAEEAIVSGNKRTGTLVRRGAAKIKSLLKGIGFGS